MRGIREDVKFLRSTGECERLILGDPEIGKNVWIGPWVILDGTGGLKIGDNTTICAGVKIYTHTNEDRDMHGGRSFTGRVRIGHHCFVGSNVVIEPDVIIGNYVKIGANSFVRRGTITGSNQTWAGCPATRRVPR